MPNWLATLIAILSALLALWGVAESRRANLTAERAVSISQDQFEIARQPRLVLSPEPHETDDDFLLLAVEGERLVWSIQFKVSNAGGSTAKNVRFLSSVEFVGTPNPPQMLRADPPSPIDIPQDLSLGIGLRGFVEWPNQDDCDCADRLREEVESGSAKMILGLETTYESESERQKRALKLRSEYGDGNPRYLEQVEG